MVAIAAPKLCPQNHKFLALLLPGLVCNNFADTYGHSSSTSTLNPWCTLLTVSAITGTAFRSALISLNSVGCVPRQAITISFLFSKRYACAPPLSKNTVLVNPCDFASFRTGFSSPYANDASCAKSKLRSCNVLPSILISLLFSKYSRHHIQ